MNPLNQAFTLFRCESAGCPAVVRVSRKETWYWEGLGGSNLLPALPDRGKEERLVPRALCLRVCLPVQGRSHMAHGPPLIAAGVGHGSGDFGDFIPHCPATWLASSGN